jgi:hypothetical protein
MRKFLIGGAVLAAAAMTVVAANAQDLIPPQTTFTVDAKVLPNKAGTPKDPQGVKIKVAAKLNAPEGYERPILTHGYALLPRAGNFNSRLFPGCTKPKLDRDGPEACPEKSRIGSARAVAYADTIVTHPKIEIFNGTQKVAFGYVTLYQPALVQIAVPARIQEFPRGKWKYKVSIKVPTVLQVVAGVPIYPSSIKGWVGRGELIATTSCPKSRRWPYEATAFFNVGEPYTYRGSVPCRPSD